MKRRIWCLILPVMTLILEILPYGAVCNFARPATDGSIGRFRELYSYFDLTPFGYANFAPFITALITCIIILVLAVYCITGNKRLARTARNLLIACFTISLGPLAYGIDFFSVVGLLISLSLIAEAAALHWIAKVPDATE